MAALRLFLLFLLSLLSILITTPSPSAAESNIMYTKQLISTNNGLSGGNANLVIQKDCNLVIYRKQGQYASMTNGRGTNCRLTLSNTGQLLIIDGDSRKVVATIGKETENVGEYAAILDSNGVFGIYGPATWPLSQADAGETAQSVPDSVGSLSNLMFSSQQLDDGGPGLRSRDYRFAVEDCTLNFVKGTNRVWRSPGDQGGNCFMRLNHAGQITLLDDRYRKVWESPESTFGEGIYALVLKSSGQVGLYGPQVWSA